MAHAADVVTLGEAMVLFWPTGGESLDVAVHYDRSFGGAESNLSIALARLGHHPRWIGRFGDDPFGRYVRAQLEREGVLVEAAVDADAPTAVFFKERVAAGPRRVVYYRRGSAASRFGPADIRAEHLAGARLLHLTGITLALSSSCAAAMYQMIDLAHSAGLTICVDPNVRPQLWPSADECSRAQRALLARADLALLGHEDAAVVFPGLDEASVLHAVASLGPSVVVLKRGDRGALALAGGRTVAAPAHATQVVDTVGAGDGFDAGFISGVLRGWPLERCLDLGARIGAAAVAVAGDWEGYPTAKQLGL